MKGDSEESSIWVPVVTRLGGSEWTNSGGNEPDTENAGGTKTADREVSRWVWWWKRVRRDPGHASLHDEGKSDPSIDDSSGLPKSEEHKNTAPAAKRISGIRTRPLVQTGWNGHEVLRGIEAA